MTNLDQLTYLEGKYKDPSVKILMTQEQFTAGGFPDSQKFTTQQIVQSDASQTNFKKIQGDSPNLNVRDENMGTTQTTLVQNQQPYL